jgi:hypothetical protein
LPSHHQRASRPLGAVGLLMAAVLALAGCSSSSSKPDAAPSSPGESARFGGDPPVATEVSIAHVAGIRPHSYRRHFHASAGRLRTKVGAAVDAWFDGGFVRVDYPSRSYPDAFASFTPRARQDATRQKKLMTTGPLGARIDGVTTVRRSVRLDVLAPRGRAAGVTARFLLRLRTSGTAHQRVTVTGRLFLTRSSAGAWKIFGYDVAKAAA